MYSKLNFTSGNRHHSNRWRICCFVTSISAKVLSAELKELEMNGFVNRNVFTGTPVVVEYELSEYADTLNGVLQSLSEWGAMHRENVKKCMKKKKPAIA